MTTTLFTKGRSQAVRLPKDLRLPGKEVSIRKLGNGVFIEPITRSRWPKRYFDSILIEDECFARSDLGVTPPVPAFESSSATRPNFNV